jgi:hypothetical protein
MSRRPILSAINFHKLSLADVHLHSPRRCDERSLGNLKHPVFAENLLCAQDGQILWETEPECQKLSGRRQEQHPQKRKIITFKVVRWECHG